MRYRELPIFLIDQEKQNLGLTVEDEPAKAIIDIDKVVAVRETMKDNECCIYIGENLSFIIGMSYVDFAKMLTQ